MHSVYEFDIGILHTLWFKLLQHRSRKSFSMYHMKYYLPILSDLNFLLFLLINFYVHKFYMYGKVTKILEVGL